MLGPAAAPSSTRSQEWLVNGWEGGEPKAKRPHGLAGRNDFLYNTQENHPACLFGVQNSPNWLHYKKILFWRSRFRSPKREPTNFSLVPGIISVSSSNNYACNGPFISILPLWKVASADVLRQLRSVDERLRACSARWLRLEDK